MRKLFVLATILFITSLSFGQFEGKLDFVKTKGNSEVHFSYSVKGERVRIDEFGKESNLEGIQIVNTTSGAILALSPNRKMYMEAKNKRPQRVANVEVTKSKTIKTIAGVKCRKWTVECKEQDRKIIYWVADGSYRFFNPLLRAMNRAEKSSIYWLQIDGTDGMFPMIAEEYNSASVLISKLEVNKVEKKSMKAETFQVPSDYKKFEK